MMFFVVTALETKDMNADQIKREMIELSDILFITCHATAKIRPHTRDSACAVRCCNRLALENGKAVTPAIQGSVVLE